MKKSQHSVRRYEQTGCNCGPNSLAQLLSFYGETYKPLELREMTTMLKNCGTFDGHLGVTAMKLGYKARVTPMNMYAFDPTWYGHSRKKLITLLKKQLAGAGRDAKYKVSLRGYIEFLENGGTLEFKPISKGLLAKKVGKHPVIVGLCSTYYYRRPRTKKTDSRFRSGHFVVVNGYDPKTDQFSIVDPWHTIPFSKTGRYKRKADELIAAMYLGEGTYDSTIVEVIK